MSKGNIGVEGLDAALPLGTLRLLTLFARSRGWDRWWRREERERSAASEAREEERATG